jgi:hypothetical protein
MVRGLLPAALSLLPLTSLRLVRSMRCLTAVGLLTLMAALRSVAVGRLVELLFALVRAEVIGLPIMLTLGHGLFGLNVHSANGVFHNRLLKVIDPTRRRTFSQRTRGQCASFMPEITQAGAYALAEAALY